MQVAKPVANSLSPVPGEEEALVYLGVGAAIALVLSASLMVGATSS